MNIFFYLYHFGVIICLVFVSAFGVDMGPVCMSLSVGHESLLKRLLLCFLSVLSRISESSRSGINLNRSDSVRIE